jgi:hypothetical protein
MGGDPIECFFSEEKFPEMVHRAISPRDPHAPNAARITGDKTVRASSIEQVCSTGLD